MNASNAREDRRREPRIEAECAVKLYDPQSRRYTAGQTRNVSTGGALIELAAPIAIPTGEPIGVAIDPTNSRAGLRQNDLSAATVVRRQIGGGQRLIAVRFVCPQDVPAQAAA